LGQLSHTTGWQVRPTNGGQTLHKNGGLALPFFPPVVILKFHYITFRTFIPIVSLLALYTHIGLMRTYKYRAGLSAGQRPDNKSEILEKEKIWAEVEKNA